MIATAAMWTALGKIGYDISDEQSFNIPAAAVVLTVLVDIVGYVAAAVVLMQ